MKKAFLWIGRHKLYRPSLEEIDIPNETGKTKQNKKKNGRWDWLPKTEMNTKKEDQNHKSD